MLDRLPDPILLALLKEAPQLTLVNRKLYSLAELLAHARLLSYFDFDDQEIEELAADIRDHMQFESWRTAEGVARSDYWMFAPEHVVDTVKGVYTLPGEPCGLQLSNWANKTLEYTTRLRCGTYSIYLDALMDSVAVLSQISLQVVGCQSVKQHFSCSPSRRWVESQIDTTGSGASGHQGSSGDRGDAESMESTQWYVGAIEVYPQSDESEWADFTLQMKIYGWDESLTGIVLNYLKFEPARFDITDRQWILNARNDQPSFGMAEVYRRASARKRRWSQKAHNPPAITP